jgi:hypothetical protein
MGHFHVIASHSAAVARARGISSLISLHSASSHSCGITRSLASSLLCGVARSVGSFAFMRDRSTPMCVHRCHACSSLPCRFVACVPYGGHSFLTLIARHHIHMWFGASMHIYRFHA